MAPTFSVTYEVVTEESAAQGDAADRGYLAEDWTLHDIIGRFGRNSLEDSGSWFSTVDADTDYQSGDATYYSVHPPRTITRASYARLRRVLAYKH